MNACEAHQPFAHNHHHDGGWRMPFDRFERRMAQVDNINAWGESHDRQKAREQAAFLKQELPRAIELGNGSAMAEMIRHLEAVANGRA
jgi:hypothetical protein